MNTDHSLPIDRRAEVHAALGDPTRLAIVDRLVLGDASPAELGRALELPSNLLAHHVKLLERARLVERSRSEGDHRRIYLRLCPAALAGLVPVDRRQAPRVVFVCTRNSARSQLAAALWARASEVPTASAGTEPAEGVHPRAVAVAQRRGIPLTGATTAHVADVLNDSDLIVAVCDNAHEALPRHATARLHWSVPDPAPADSDQAFESAFDEITDRINLLAPAVHHTGADHD